MFLNLTGIYAHKQFDTQSMANIFFCKKPNLIASLGFHLTYQSQFVDIAITVMSIDWQLVIIGVFFIEFFFVFHFDTR